MEIEGLIGAHVYAVGKKEIRLGYYIAKVFDDAVGMSSDYECVKIFADRKLAQHYADLLNELELIKVIEEFSELIDYQRNGGD